MIAFLLREQKKNLVNHYFLSFLNKENRAQAVFNHTEDYVMFPDEATTSLCCWDSRNASRKQLLSLGHNGAVRNIVHSTVSPAFLTSSDDFRARFWFKRSSSS
ncbi:Cleavage stimulation factor 50 kDa subunit [Caligus rogercresseyi]|uniref:Cleavage stimulation factor 50 kDa subunit n=1 Tax=Caligus rogercresseyi TaxID=217165 RepID=A0A7T8KJA2_CALRO|nr:Cleavage stimulation factor 50 kDa subunit [Caligus rogercresseyi]